MIQYIKDLPDNVVGFRAMGTVIREDYQNVVIPHIERLVERTGKLNFLLVLDTEIENFTAGAWLQDAMVGLKNIANWNRSAIVTDSEKIIGFTNGFSYLVPGEFRGFKKENYDDAAAWVSENSEA